MYHNDWNFIQEGHEDHDHELSGDELAHMLEEVSHPCDEMIVRCSFEAHERNCSQIFRDSVQSNAIAAT